MRTGLGLVFASLALLIPACGTDTAKPAGPDSGNPDMDADAGMNPDGQGNLDAGPTAFAPTLSSAKVQVSGRTGMDLHFEVKGKDRDLDIVSMRVHLLDGAGGDVIVFDSDRDGVVDSAEGVLGFDEQKLVGEALTASTTLRGLLLQVPGVAKARVALKDATDMLSEEQTVDVAEQPVKNLGEPCDPLYLADRCQAGQGCSGDPSTCHEGVPPEITKIAYYHSDGGPMILIEGTEPEDDLATLHMEFQDAAGAPVAVGADETGAGGYTSFDYDVSGSAVDGVFFFRMKAGVGLDSIVSTIVVTPSDSVGHMGAAKTAKVANPPVRAKGVACDPRGFDVCAVELVCTPGEVGGTNKCDKGSTVRATQCAAAPVLVPTAAGASIIGKAEGVSLWDTPPGCSSADPKGRPEGIVVLRLTERANKLTLSTYSTKTTFDTALYFLLGCPDDIGDAFGCSDDAPDRNGASELVLDDVAPGDYLVVIDSFSYDGGTFQLTATAE